MQFWSGFSTSFPLQVVLTSRDTHPQYVDIQWLDMGKQHVFFFLKAQTLNHADLWSTRLSRKILNNGLNMTGERWPPQSRVMLRLIEKQNRVHYDNRDRHKQKNFQWLASLLLDPNYQLRQVYEYWSERKGKQVTKWAATSNPTIHPISSPAAY